MTRLLAIVLVLALAAPAAAQQPDAIAPPGNAAIDEYLETVPGADGNRRVDRSRSGGLGASERRALEQLGPDGRLAAEVLSASVASDPGARRASRSPGTQRSSEGDGGVAARAESLAAAGEGKSGVAAMLDGVLAGGAGDGPGMGLLLPVVLLGALVLFVLGRVLRGRRPGA